MSKDIWNGTGKTESDTDVMDKEDVRESEPNMFKVIFHNDNVTTVNFVAAILMTLFHKSETEAMEITVHIHENGRGIAGIYSHEVAEQKSMETMTVARTYSYPLNVTFEEDI